MDKKSALENLGYKLDHGKYKKEICTEGDKTYTLACTLGGAGYQVEKKEGDKEDINGAGFYSGKPLYAKIEEMVSELQQMMKSEEPEIVEEPRGFVDGGYKVQDATYEEIGEQKEAPLPKPGRRIKNIEAEMMEGGKIRAGKKGLSESGRPIPQKTEYFTVTTMNRKKVTDPNDPDSGFERDEHIHSIVGNEPKKLRVRLACDKEDLNLITFFGRYAGAACECRGDGFTAQKLNGDIIPCAGEECETFIKGECKRHGILSVILEDAPRCGIVHKFRTTSRNSINNLTASLALLTMCSNGHIAGLPLLLTLTPKETTIPKTKKRTTIYMANLEYRGTYPDMQEHLQKLIQDRNGRDPVREYEKLAEAALEVPESPDECMDVAATFFPAEA
jgi:hypothetical protein